MYPGLTRNKPQSTVTDNRGCWLPAVLLGGPVRGRSSKGLPVGEVVRLALVSIAVTLNIRLLSLAAIVRGGLVDEKSVGNAQDEEEPEKIEGLQGAE
jgi:hypothetical protein